MIPLDSLTLALLCGLLAQAESAGFVPRPEDSVSFNITITVEVFESLTVSEGAPTGSPPVMRWQPLTDRGIFTNAVEVYPDRTVALAGRWGLGGFFGRVIGHASARDYAGLDGWALRAGTICDNDIRRAREMRLSLVRGVF